MTLQLKALLVLATALAILVNFSSSTTLCGDWYHKLGKQGHTLEVKVLKPHSWGGINSKGSGRPTRELSADVGVCETYTNTTRGACLWIGDNARTATPHGLTPGWLTDNDKSNCGKHFIVKRGQKHCGGRIVDACSFVGDGAPLTTTQGCSAIYVTKALYTELGGNVDDPNDVGSVQIDSWDFTSPPV
ncbi:hypothetical protein MJO28_012802 [Puccinia striiformis f. sp. tritici]|uniref:Secreted protein n=2 Tax=Puccinia striiformis f. sp. tritici TaxID=168172 RepID=A0A0L0VMX5_9BASI|nr:hypothetical protein Pst134EA_024700 [Puccinia striiformis f. sp. tritici]KAI9631416.1 hypothetical protein KEM48_014390 [Puccinia striiformis f. sp. tritici PST-130]KNF00375.1 hypothetical protein PSTG_06305 [Puccinia striiformis f. sp. tritici PST-78]KAH9445110.1 hypothetical protein Pst134EB_025359 [Puccinia striiformis f. sp. tritici]KAH9453835.1 hypothetical protein Pst134EA_024700 [Puccinia striiformis f. sp. tritici]KAI7940517.1 hypothetical protein MJO28_012802 [Puccinia striiformis